ncbi:MAG: TerB family tellurite resistance protein [Myxococcales bacterium]|nr:TerB family tellurite resistance protein [Myxococcales bacterium]
MSLLPLVQVAWADGRIQDRERELILGVADKHGLLDEHSREMIESWLAEAPSGYFNTTAGQVLAELLRRAKVPAELDREAIAGWCWAIAGAAGGLLGTRLFAISAAERSALDEIGRVLDLDEVPADWAELTLTDE